MPFRKTLRRRIRRSTNSESLELRCLLSTITVTSSADEVADDGQITLREAIQAANTNTSVDGSNAGSDTEVDVIEFATAVETIELSLGDFDIEDNVIIRGPSGRVTIDAQEGSRHFDVTVGGLAFTVENMRLINGLTTETEATGGSIRLDEPIGTAGIELNVINSQFENNESAWHGGAISVVGEEPASGDLGSLEVTIRDSTFTNSTAAGSGGAILVVGESNVLIEGSSFDGSTAHRNGGTVMVFDRDGGGDRGISNATVIDSSFTNGEATGNNGQAAWGGGFYYFGNGRSEVSGSYFAGNRANFGGGIAITGADGTSHILRDSIVEDNNTAQEGGGVQGIFLTVVNSTIRNNHTDGIGGGVKAWELRMFDSEVSNNTADSDGAGVYVGQTSSEASRETFSITTVIQDSEIDSNTADSQGGGIYSGGGTLRVEGTQISSNSARLGGGIGISQSNLELTGSSVANNTASTWGGGLLVFASNNGATIRNSTIAGNTADTAGGGIYGCLLYTSPSPRDRTRSRMPSSA